MDYHLGDDDVYLKAVEDMHKTNFKNDDPKWFYEHRLTVITCRIGQNMPMMPLDQPSFIHAQDHWDHSRKWNKVATVSFSPATHVK